MLALRTIEISPPKEAGTLLFERMTGGEMLGRPFGFDVDMLSSVGDIAIPDVLGKPFSVMLSLADSVRWFNGIVARFGLVGWTGDHFRYRATLRPMMWLLTRTSNCRIFQNQSIPDIIMGIFSAHGIPAKKQLGRESYATWEYLVQYNETDFNLVSRLMEQEGISYYFVHEEGKHTLVLIDALTVHDEVPGYEKITYSNAGDRAESSDASHERIDSWSVAMQIEPGSYVAKEFDFEKPRAPLLSTASAPNPHAHADGELFEYPGVYVASSERDEYVKRRLEEQQLDYAQVHGGGNAAGLTPGFRFGLTDHPADPQNGEYLVISASYTLAANLHITGGTDAGPDFRCSFTGIDAKRHYRTPVTTPKPYVAGPQTATVVGSKGEEIWTDKYGRVKVQFHWDRVGGKDEKSSCWVRVSQAWAGTQWGAIHIPRIGQEVIVDFLEGDPDRPIITGRVYNGDNMPPYDLPANQTQSGIKSRSTKGGSPANFNELRFEDKKGTEHVYLQAEKDLQILVKNDETREVDHDRTKHVKHDETVNVDNDRTETVGKDESITIVGNRTESVGKDEDITIGANRSETVGKNESITIGGQRSETVALTEEITVGGTRSLTVGISDSTSVGGNSSLDVGKDQSVTVSGARTLSVTKDETITVDGKQAVTIGKDQIIEVTKKLSITVSDEISIVTGDASITMKKDGTIIIKGKDITLDGSGKVNVKAASDVIIKGSKISQN